MLESHRKELAALIDQFSGAEGINETAISGVNCIRLTALNARLPSVYTPCLCVIVQGKKRVMLEGEIYQYKPSQYLVISVDLPVIGEVTEGSKAIPYLCLQVALDQHQLTELMIQAQHMRRAKSETRRGIFVGDVDDALSDSVLRLARLLKAPQDISLLAPMIKREIYYRLLKGPFGEAIGQLAQTGSHMHRISLAIQQLKENYNQPIRIEDLASRVGMSVSSFHAHFKTVTAMSPLQYQKRLRLMEARQIMVTELQDAASAAYRVGYESPSQFSREYARMFGNPPARDINFLRQQSPNG